MVIRCNLFLLFHNWAVWVELSSDSSYQILGMIFGGPHPLKVDWWERPWPGLSVGTHMGWVLCMWLSGFFSACSLRCSSQGPPQTRWKLDLQWLSLYSHSVTSAMRVRPVKCKVGTWNLVSFSGDRQTLSEGHERAHSNLLLGSEIGRTDAGW